MPVAGDAPECADARKRLGAAPMVLAPVDEAGVDPERDVVQEEAVVDAGHVDPPFDAGEGRQGSQRIVSVEAEVAREVVSRPERDADKGQPALDRHLGDRRERPVAPRDPEGPGLRARARAVTSSSAPRT